jgi:hypothetical protein
VSLISLEMTAHRHAETLLLMARSSTVQPSDVLRDSLRLPLSRPPTRLYEGCATMRFTSNAIFYPAIIIKAMQMESAAATARHVGPT